MTTNTKDDITTIAFGAPIGVVSSLFLGVAAGLASHSLLIGFMSGLGIFFLCLLIIFASTTAQDAFEKVCQLSSESKTE